MDDKNKIREDKPRNINPEDVDFTHSAKQTKAQDKIDIKESELGRETSQMPATENLDLQTTQIDEDTLGLNDSNPIHKAVSSEDLLNESTNERGYRGSIKSPDGRSHGKNADEHESDSEESNLI